MNSRKRLVSCLVFLVLCTAGLPQTILSYPLFIYRPHLAKNPLSEGGRISLHGEYFGNYQAPSSFPSYNDLSGPPDKWTFGFQNMIFLTRSTFFLAQLVTHDDGQQRTKFDWHFSLRQNLHDNLVLIIGHDSNHDSDAQSFMKGKRYFLNRNYIGFGLPFQRGKVFIEPFTWFFHHSNQHGHLDLSGNRIRQEYGLRIGTWIEDSLGISFQVISQTEILFSRGEAYLVDIIVRYRIIEYLELSFGGSLWKDTSLSPGGSRQTFSKLHWGLAIPF